MISAAFGLAGCNPPGPSATAHTARTPHGVVSTSESDETSPETGLGADTDAPAPGFGLLTTQDEKNSVPRNREGLETDHGEKRRRRSRDEIREEKATLRVFDHLPEHEMSREEMLKLVDDAESDVPDAEVDEIVKYEEDTIPADVPSPNPVPSPIPSAAPSPIPPPVKKTDEKKDKEKEENPSLLTQTPSEANAPKKPECDPIKETYNPATNRCEAKPEPKPVIPTCLPRTETYNAAKNACEPKAKGPAVEKPKMPVCDVKTEVYDSKTNACLDKSKTAVVEKPRMPTCKTGETYNSGTNKCDPKPKPEKPKKPTCKAGETYNPGTNACDPKPKPETPKKPVCKANQTYNPTANKCETKKSGELEDDDGIDEEIEEIEKFTPADLKSIEVIYRAKTMGDYRLADVGEKFGSMRPKTAFSKLQKTLMGSSLKSCNFFFAAALIEAGTPGVGGKVATSQSYPAWLAKDFDTKYFEPAGWKKVSLDQLKQMFRDGKTFDAAIQRNPPKGKKHGHIAVVVGLNKAGVPIIAEASYLTESNRLRAYPDAMFKTFNIFVRSAE